MQSYLAKGVGTERGMNHGSGRVYQSQVAENAMKNQIHGILSGRQLFTREITRLILKKYVSFKL